MLWYARNSTMILLFSVTIPSSVFFLCYAAGSSAGFGVFCGQIVYMHAVECVRANMQSCLQMNW